ncbi:hypothetical protein [uncultured Deinococcus sp.]|uniref:hypothetical protein n=1 Tax=uncultured Deinococcus sp. TaxID=158789 RepID=UPI003748B980
MTQPAGLSEDLQDELEVLVGPDAWAYHEALPAGKVDVVRAYRVRQSISLVAVDVLEAAAAAARKAASGGAAVSKKIKLGPIEIERVVTASSLISDASTWEGRASTLRQQASSTFSFAPLMSDWGVEP